jgi:hypothetical protein
MIPVGLFTIRQADHADLDRIEELDQLFGNAALTREYFEAWLRHHPEGFLVAEYDGRVYGYSMVIYLHARIRSARTGITTRAVALAARTRRWASISMRSVLLRRSRRQRARCLSPIGGSLSAPMCIRRLSSAGCRDSASGSRHRVILPRALDSATKRRLLDVYVNTLHDPYQVFYEGLSFMPEYGVVDYLEGDDESLNCALKLVWRNPYYKPLTVDRAVAEIPAPTPASR